ncbi:hypothetical protein ACF3M2_01920 [Tissierella carlieri]|uniref:hypothetical protein n=1 Tax=Tissierella carlieri TaxID=689904 RepID=UPI0038699226
MLDDTVIFVVIKDDKGNLDYAEVRTVGDVKDALKKDVDKAYVLNGKEHEDIARTRTSGINRENEAHTVVFTDIDIQPDVKTEIAKFVGFDDRQETLMNVEFANRSEKTIKIARGTDLPKDLRIGDIISYEITKEKEEKDRTVTKVEVAIAKDSKTIYEVKDADAYGTIKLSNGKTYFENSKTESFGGSLRVGDKVSIYHGKDDNYLLATLKRDKDAVVGGGDEASGIVTYVNETRLELDKNTTHTINADTKFVKNGVTVAMGSNIKDYLFVTDQVEVKNNVITFKTSAADRLQAEKVKEATVAVEKAEASKLQADVDAAQVLVNALVAGDAKTALQNRLNAIELPKTDLQKATAAVEKAETSKLQADINAARALVNALPAGPDRVALNIRLDAITVVTSVTGVKAKGEVTTEGEEVVAPVTEAKAKVTIDTDILIEAKTAGKAGNDITIALVQPSEERKALEVKVVGNDIAVNLPTDPLGAPVAVTRGEVAAAINTSAASALVEATAATAGATAGSVTRVVLTGGVDEVVAKQAVKEVYTLTITDGATASGNIVVSGGTAPVTVAVISGMTPEMVAQAISNSGLTATDYIISVVGNKVVFTANNAGAVGTSGPAARLNITVADQ